jgi:hypothetical protein
MTFKPMTYLVSFTLFVLLFMGLGGYFGYVKIADHFLTQAFLEATPLNVQVLPDPQGNGLYWDDQVPLQHGGAARILANNRNPELSIGYSSDSVPTKFNVIPLAVNERTEDIRADKAGHYLFTRVLAPSSIKSQEITWLYKYDLRKRKVVNRVTVNPIVLPAPFRP